MKITKEILRNIIEEELEGVLNEQDYLDKAKKMLSKHPIAKGVKSLGKAARKFASTQGPRYKSRAQAQAALDKAGDAPGTDSMKKDVAVNRQAVGRLRTEIQNLKTRIGNLEAKAGMDPGST